MASILIIDDEIQIRKMLRQILEKEGYKIFTASNGQEGLKIFKNNPTDLVITDLIMPEKEGIELILELRRDYPDTKIIAISGGGKIGPEEYLEIVKKFGVQFTFSKPIKREELIKAVKDLME